MTQTRHATSPDLRWAAPPVSEAVRPKPPVPAQKRRVPWSHFLSLGGEAGRLWLEEYERAGGTELRDWTEQALELLRHRRCDEALVLLARADQRASSLEAGPPNAIALLMRRWYYASRAYYRYCVEDFARATEDLELAYQAVRLAVEARECLLPLAMHSYEFRVQHARIARTRRRWPEMWRHLEIARAMLEDSEPLCRLSDGTAVDYARLARFYGPLTGYEWEDRKSLLAVLETKYRLRLHELQLHWVYAPAGFIIQYP